MRRTAGALAVSGVLLAGWTVLRAQTPYPAGPASPDIMPALLEEVRGLRAALEQMTSAGPGFSSRSGGCSCRSSG